MMAVPGWERRKLTDLAEYINGYAFNPEDWGKDGLPIIRIEQLRDPGSVSDYFAGPLPEKNMIDDGDLVFSWSGSLLLGFWRHGQAALNQHLFKVVEKHGVARTFLKFFIEYYLPEIAKAAHGSTMQHITRKELDRFGAPFPLDTQEQTQIAAILSNIDRAIEQTEATIAKHQRIKTGLVQDLLTRGLDQHAHLRAPLAHPEQFKQTVIGQIPKTWDVSCVGSALDLSTGFTLGSHRRPRKNKRGYLRVANVMRDRILLDDIAELEARDDEMAGRILQVDDLLVVEGHANPDEIGRCARVPPEAIGLTFQNHLFRLRCARLNPRFAIAWLNGEWMRAHWKRLCGTSSGLNTINSTMLRRAPIPIPGGQEQLCIAAVLHAHDARIGAEEAALAKLRQLKQGLMQDLLTGYIRVTRLLEQDTPGH